MVRIDANGVAFEIKRELAVLDVLQFVFVEIRPSPYPSVYNVRKALSAGDLQPPVEGPLNRDAFTRMRAVRSYSSYETVQLVSFFLRLNKTVQYNFTKFRTILLSILFFKIVHFKKLKIIVYCIVFKYNF